METVFSGESLDSLRFLNDLESASNYTRSVPSRNQNVDVAGATPCRLVDMGRKRQEGTSGLKVSLHKSGAVNEPTGSASRVSARKP